MALKFLNKKGWHTGSLRNIENVWKAEQKHEAEQKKLEELRKQIHEERERAEFRQLQEQAGLIPKQERLDFLYESGLAVGKGGPGFKALESLPKTDSETASSSTANKQQQSSAPGALFDEKPQSANDAWRKLHSDPLLLIRQKEQEALARVKNNPIQMAMIRKSIESEEKGKDKDEKKHKRKKSKHRKHSSSDSEDTELGGRKHRDDHHKRSKSHKAFRRASRTSDEEPDEADDRRRPYYDKDHKVQRQSGSSNHRYDHKYDRSGNTQTGRSCNNSQNKEHHPEQHVESRHDKRSHFSFSDKPPRHESNNSHRRAGKLTEEERAAKLREMQMDAELHEEQRWKRIKKAADSDAQEAIHDQATRGRNFLDAAQKSIYGAEKGGSSTIEESVRRRTHYSQGRSATDTNAFRRS